ncbi:MULTISPECIES: hypothetical protein [Paenibacillus]|uniref:hypothetical protein n=1 Tax=Paenibacillus TaxID=44249 RepID=UPI00036EA5EB|nr:MULTISPECIES: hypothetical protein [Paenibacillus]
MKKDTDLSLWMTQFLCSSDSIKEVRMEEAEQEHNPRLLESIRFHLELRNRHDLLEHHSLK